MKGLAVVVAGARFYWQSRQGWGLAGLEEVTLAPAATYQRAQHS